jgi:ubiquinone/menaquinone biosynthesis C-methylase UbiE
VAAAAIPFSPGTAEYFRSYDGLREANEPLAWSSELHEFAAFAGRRVLDVGSGNGYVLSKYAAQGARVYGVDLTRTGIALCRQRFDLCGFRGNFCVANAEDLPFRNETFDCVCCMGVLHHTPDPPRAVREISRVMRPGGRLIAMVYHRHSAMYRLLFPLSRLRTGKSLQQMVNEVDGLGNPKGAVYSRAELEHLLSPFEDLTFAVALLQRWMLPPVLRTCLPDAAIRRLAPWCGWFLYAKGRKPSPARTEGPATKGRGLSLSPLDRKPEEASSRCVESPGQSA